MRKQENADTGFTLIEMMVSIVISAIIAGAMYSTYLVQQRSYNVQEVVVETQQTIRASLMFITRELRMAGYDRDNGTSNSTCNVGAVGLSVRPGILTTNPAQLDLSSDLNSDGDCADTDENNSYYLYIAADGIQKLGRRDNNNLPVQSIADNVEAVQFRYLDTNGTTTLNPSQVRAVQISILARASIADPNFINAQMYCPGSHPTFNAGLNQCTDASGATLAPWGPYNDNLRRRLLITTVQARNLGL